MTAAHEKANCASACAACPGMERLLPALEGLAPAYLVGGAVRDLLRGADAVDLDVAVEGDARSVARALAERLGGEAREHERFGTATVRADDLSVDLATTRRETYPEPGVLPVVEEAGLDEDLVRRDFTINAMALGLTGDDLGHLYDPLRRAGRPGRARGSRAARAQLHGRPDPPAARASLRGAARLPHGPGHRAARARRGRRGRPAHRLGGARARRADGPARRAGAARRDRAHARARCRPGHAHGDGGGPRAGRLGGARAPWHSAPTARSWRWRRSARRPRSASICGSATSTCPPGTATPCRGPPASRRGWPTSCGSREHTPSELRALLGRETLVALALALAMGAPSEPILRWVTELRSVRLEISGADLLAEGVPEGPGARPRARRDAVAQARRPRARPRPGARDRAAAGQGGGR